MGDRCYMHITCRREDRELFQLIGFLPEFDQTPDSAIIEMVDEEANYAHAEEMPTNVPYYGHHGSGGNYGQHSLACDGRRFAEVETGFDGGFVVVWDTTRNRPTAESLRAEFSETSADLLDALVKALTTPIRRGRDFDDR